MTKKATSADLVTVYKVTRPPYDDDKPFRLVIAKVKQVPTGWRMLWGREYFGYRTRFTHRELEPHLTPEAALFAARARAERNLRHAEDALAQAQADHDALMEFTL